MKYKLDQRSNPQQPETPKKRYSKMKRFSRIINYWLFSFFNNTKTEASQEEIDVIIPVIKKDLRILPLCIEGVKTCVKNPVKDIYIVAPPQEEIVTFCKNSGLLYINEASVVGFTPRELNLTITNRDGTTSDRSGWLYQQFIKLSGTVGTCRNYLCIDADHILLQPHVFLNKSGTPVFYMSSGRHQPYYDMIQKLTGSFKLSTMSYVAHKMIMNKEQITSLHEHIQDYTHENWIKSIISRYDRTQISGFSEFEIYGNFIQNKILLPWKQHAATYKYLADYQNLVKRFGKKYRSITFPEYYNH
jgi:hypothetical protein